MKKFLRIFVGIVFVVALVYLFGLSRSKSFVFGNSDIFHRASFEREVEILFVGDVMFARNIASIIEANGQDFPLALISRRLNESEAVVANLEGPISSRGVNQGSIYSFRFDPEVVDILKSGNIRAVSLANNHIWDWGRNALSDTLMHLKGAHIAYAGAGLNKAQANLPARFRVGDFDVAMFSFTTLYPSSLEAKDDRMGISDFDLDKLEIDIAAEREVGADLVFVVFHWGREYETESSEDQRLIARKVIDLGADLVVGHHPHVAQELEEYKGKFIAYSLGNFLFDQNFSKDTSRGLMLSVRIKGGEIEAVEPIEVKFNDSYQPYLSGLVR